MKNSMTTLDNAINEQLKKEATLKRQVISIELQELTDTLKKQWHDAVNTTQKDIDSFLEHQESQLQKVKIQTQQTKKSKCLWKNIVTALILISWTGTTVFLTNAYGINFTSWILQKKISSNQEKRSIREEINIVVSKDNNVLQIFLNSKERSAPTLHLTENKQWVIQQLR